MIRKIFILLLTAVLILAGIILFNTVRYSKKLPEFQSLQIDDIPDSAAHHLSQAVQIRTVSYGDTLAIDTTEFLRFRAFMENSYPLVHQRLTRQVFNQFSYLFTWKGKDSLKAPWVLMAHLDVVPVEPVAEKQWLVPSFSGLIQNDTIWGRGTTDDKSSAIAILETVEQLLKKDFVPEQTIYLSFGHDEEIAGRRGAATIANWFKEQKIKPGFVLDEGGQIDNEHFKDLKRPIAVIGVGEKGYVNLDLRVEIPGGHSSMPVKETAIDVLNEAIDNIREKQMPARITAPVQEMLDRIGPGQAFMNRMALSNLWLFKGTIIRKMEKTKESNALVHTTLVPTIVKAGIKDNVIPSVATATLNSRILPGETSEDVVAFVRKAVGDDRVQVKKQTISLMEPSSSTSSSHAMFKKLESVVYKTVPKVVVSPYLMIGATDSRFFRPFSEAVLNFIPMQDAKGFHGINERIGIPDLKRMIFFYRLLITSK